MILLKQKRKRLYVPPQIEVTEYEDDLLGGGITGSAPNQDPFGPDPWGAKSTSYFEDDVDGFEDSYEDDWDYETYKKQQMLW